jgi:hypothetical protein
MLQYKEMFYKNQLCQIWYGLKPNNYLEFTPLMVFPYPDIMKKEIESDVPWDTYSLKFLRVFSKEGPIDLFRILYPDIETEGQLIYSPIRGVSVSTHIFNENGHTFVEYDG